MAQLVAIAQAMPERHKRMIWLASWCALRYGEIAELRRSDVKLSPDGASGVIQVRRAVIFLKGSKEVGRPKSDAGIRNVAIPPHVIPVVVEHLRHHAARGPSGLLFPADGGGHLWPSVVQKHFRLA